jgi:multidrug efflux pump subunit AcrA (membrane-fusion protein)
MGINPTKIESNNLYSELSVRSPINGYISNILSKIGSYVDASTPLAEIVDNGQLHLDINVFEKDLPLIKVGQIIHFNLTNNPTTEYDAQVYSIGSSFEDASKTIPVHCKIKGKNKGLIDGMSITALVSLNDITSPSLPSEAIVSSEGKYYIFIVTDKQMEEHKENNENHNEQNQANEHVKGDAHKHLKEKKQNTVIEKTVNFEKIEVLKGVTYLGFTAITPMTEIPKNAKIVTKGAFFVNAKMVNQGEGHNH